MSENTPSEPGKGAIASRHDEDLCLDLLHDFLPSEEKEALLNRMAEDPVLEAVFRRLVRERERLRASRSLRRLPSGDLIVEKVGVAQEEVQPRQQGNAWERLLESWQTAANRRRLVLTAGVTAAAALLVFVLLPRLQSPDARALLHPLPAYAEDLQVRSAENDHPDQELVAGLRAYSREEYRTAIGHLERARNEGPLETVRKLYLGSALAQQAQWEQAVAVLASHATTPLPDPWGSESRWTLAIALAESGNQTGADSLLQALAAEPGEVGERALDLLNEWKSQAP
jgi:hypothetical protein